MSYKVFSAPRLDVCRAQILLRFLITLQPSFIQSQRGYFHPISLRVGGAIFIAKLYQQFRLICVPKPQTLKLL